MARRNTLQLRVPNSHRNAEGVLASATLFQFPQIVGSLFPLQQQDCQRVATGILANILHIWEFARGVNHAKSHSALILQDDAGDSVDTHLLLVTCIE